MITAINTSTSNVESSPIVIESRPLSPFKTDEQRLDAIDSEGYYDNLFLDSEDISRNCLTLSKTSSMSSSTSETNEEGKLSHETMFTAQHSLFPSTFSGEVINFDNFCDDKLLSLDSDEIFNSLMNDSSSSSTVENTPSVELPSVSPQNLEMDVNVFETNEEKAQSEVVRYMFYAAKLRTADTTGIKKIIDIETKLLINIVAGILWQNGLKDDANKVSACESLFSPAFQQWLPSKQFIIGQPPAFMWNTCNFGCEDFVYLEQYVSKYGLYGNSFIGYCGSAIDRKLKQLEFQICPPVSFFSKNFDKDLKETIVIIRGENYVKPANVSAKRMRDYVSAGQNKRARHCSECLKVHAGLNDSSYGSMSDNLCRDCYNKTLI